MFCSKCGNKLNDTWKVCPECGTVIKTERNINYGNNQVTDSKNRKSKNEKKPIYKRIWFWILILVFGFLLIPVESDEAEDELTTTFEETDSNHKEEEAVVESELEKEEQAVLEESNADDFEYKEPSPLTYDFAKDVEKGYLFAHVNGTIIDENGVSIPEYGNYTVLASGSICKGNEVLDGYTVDRDGRIVYEELEVFYEFFVSEGRYYDFSNGSDNIIYSVEINNVTDTTFDFCIYEYDTVVFKHHTAKITSSCTGTYNGSQYTLYFSWLDPGTVSIKGFELVDGLDFINNAYYQVS